MYPVLYSIEQLNSAIRELKRVNKRLLSNCYLSQNELIKLISKGQIYFDYNEGNYLTFWYQERNFFRIYFWMTRLDSFSFPDELINKFQYVCEIYGDETDKKTETLVEMSIERGFSQYSSFHKWRFKGVPEFSKIQCDYYIDEKKTKGIYEGIMSNFDIYSDHIPLIDDFQEFITESKHIVLRNDHDEAAAGIVINGNGRIKTEEYVFVSEKYRGRGLAMVLHNLWYRSLDKDTQLLVAWVRDDNIPSIKLHSRIGYQKLGTIKVTLMSGL